MRAVGWRAGFAWVAGWSVLLLAAASLVIFGLRWRTAIFPETAQIRFIWDIGNGLDQGRQVVDGARKVASERGAAADSPSLGDMYRAWVARYDDLVKQKGGEGNFNLDYTPARLAVMSLWARWVLQHYPDAGRYLDEYAAPLLKFNTVLELLTAVGAFLLVRHWLRRGQIELDTGYGPIRRRLLADGGLVDEQSAGVSRPWVANWGALFAAGLLWLNPTMVVNAHAWPQWDVWALPFYVWAVYLASVGGWLGAGVIIGVGAMLKGQILFASPVLLIWPLVLGQFGAALRLVVGAALSGVVIVWPWLVRTPQAYQSLIITGIVAALVVPYFLIHPRRRRWHLFAGIVIVSLLMIAAWRWRPTDGLAQLWQSITLAVIILAGPWVLRHRRWMVSWAATIFVVAVVLCAMKYPSSRSWYDIGFAYPQRHYKTLHMGGTNNLAMVLQSQYGWRWTDELTVPAHFLGFWPSEPTQVLLRNAMKGAYFFTLLLCGIGAALHARRNDPRFLISVVAPWLLSFALLPQMHERYLLWASALTALCAATSVGMLFMHIVVTILGFMSMFSTMLRSNGKSALFDWRTTLDLMTHHVVPADVATGTSVQQFINTTHPGMSWLVIVISLIYLYLAVAPRKTQFRGSRAAGMAHKP